MSQVCCGCVRRVAVLLAVFLTAGCGEAPVTVAPVRSAGEAVVRTAGSAEKGVQAPGPSPGETTSATAVKQLMGIRFDVPKAWDEQPESEFYEAKYVIPSDEGEMTLTLTTMGGGIEANLQRWVGQFQQDDGDRPRRDTLRVDGTEAEWLDVRGTFRSRVGNSPGPHMGWRLLGVAIPMTPRPFLLKLIGPRAAVSSFEKKFRTFVRSGQLDN